VDSWLEWFGNSDPQTTTARKKSGTASLYVDSASGDNNVYKDLGNAIDPTAGYHTMNAWISGATEITSIIYFYNGTTLLEQRVLGQYQVNANATSWWQISATFAAPAGTTSTKIGFRAGADWYLDDITFTSHTGSTTAQYTWNTNDQLYSETVPDGYRVWTYGTSGNAKGKVTNYFQNLPGVTGSTLLTYDTTGRIITEAPAGLASHTYTYDAGSQLKTDTPSAGSAITWVYDNLGRRASEQVGTVTTKYVYNNANELCWRAVSTNTACASPPAGATSYTYDPAGRRLTEFTSASNSSTYTYDAAGRVGTIALATAGGTTTQTRSYTPADLIGGIVNTGATSGTWAYDWDQANPIAELLVQTTGGVATTLIDGNGHWAAAYSGSAAAGIGVDYYGSVIPTTGGTLHQATSYGAFGAGASAGGSLTPKLGYRGELAAGNNLYLRARTYNPTTGQFLTRDPIDGRNGTTTNTWAHAYTENSPLQHTDSAGLCTDFGCFEESSWAQGSLFATIPQVVFSCTQSVDYIHYSSTQL
jgi:RHS repeat-associated protein